ncbi:uroporphyrinogen decarboxylase family protein [Acetobacterium malicum]|uniref:uroporphyrinogen decarboxylase family protein n=1 Tax=Acetobacterium malicum TaxID=52692 RepID=UPI000403EC67|nr:uroporphyrinogen decarboxylase family protein [Acetobacterium dehalogenans]
MKESFLSEQTVEINSLFEDVFDGKTPKRVPILTNIDNAFCLEYVGFDLKKEQYSIEKTLQAIEKTTCDFNGDTVLGITLRLPQLYSILKARNFKMGADGFLQHPEVRGMEVEDYDALIADPYKALWDTILPRIYEGLNEPSFLGSKTLAFAFFTFISSMGQLENGYTEIASKYGRSTYTMASAASAEPLDMLSDQLRSFSEISKDIRRYPDKVVAACEALLPICLKAGITPKSNRYNRTFVPLHMAPYMREKDFLKFYLPTFSAYIQGMADAGVGANLFVEQDWMRYLDYLNELPKGTLMVFEYGDAKTIKEKVGDRHVVSGLYPIGLLKSGSEEQCIDKAKELVDIFAPGGGYIFSFDKAILRLNDVNADNLKAVFNFVHEYGQYK